jgi:uncharacterized protein
MATTHLPIIVGDAPAPAPQTPGSDKLWRWSPDAKLMESPSGFNIRNFANGKLAVVGEEEGRLLSQISGITIPFRLPAGLEPGLVEALQQRGIILPAEDLASHEAAVLARIARSLRDTHGLIIMPTGKCNYRCKYCYESFEQGRMTPRAADAVARAIERISGSVDQFALGFFGGEPLMCSDLVMRFSEQAFRNLSSRGLPYAASIATNGHYLTPELFEKLLDVGLCSFQVTLDGDRDLHDRQRVTVAGGETFDRIVGHLLGMARSPGQFTCILRCNARAEDMDRVVALFDGDTLAPLRDDPRFVVDLHTIWASDRQDVGDEEAKDEGCASAVTRPLDMYFYNRELETLGFRTMAYSRNPSALSISCYAGKPNWFVVGPDLSLYKCTVVFDRPENKIGRINDDGTFTLDNAKNDLWTGSTALTDSSCGTCHLRVPCAGLACPLTRFSKGHKACPEGKTIDRLRAWSHFRPLPKQMLSPGTVHKQGA